MRANDKQIAGKHYVAEYQHWDFVADALSGRYLEGVITKYITRWRKKNGVEDLLKAQHYLEKLVETYFKYIPLGTRDRAVYPCQSVLEIYDVQPLISRFVLSNQLTPQEEILITAVATWENHTDLQAAQQLLAQYIEEVRP